MAGILVAYATKYGSTAEIARAVGETIANKGMEVDVVRARKVKDVRPYGLVVLGTPVFMGKPMKEAVRFAEKFRDGLRERKVALFSVGIQMREDTPENRTEAAKVLAPIVAFTGTPETIGLFAGSIDQKRFGFFLRMFAKMEKTGLLNGGDWRDWDVIREWAGGLV